jgi:hypothetical protein
VSRQSSSLEQALLDMVNGSTANGSIVKEGFPDATAAGKEEAKGSDIESGEAHNSSAWPVVLLAPLLDHLEALSRAASAALEARGTDPSVGLTLLATTTIKPANANAAGAAHRSMLRAVGSTAEPLAPSSPTPHFFVRTPDGSFVGSAAAPSRSGGIGYDDDTDDDSNSGHRALRGNAEAWVDVGEDGRRLGSWVAEQLSVRGLATWPDLLAAVALHPPHRRRQLPTRSSNPLGGAAAGTAVDAEADGAAGTAAHRAVAELLSSILRGDGEGSAHNEDSDVEVEEKAATRAGGRTKKNSGARGGTQARPPLGAESVLGDLLRTATALLPLRSQLDFW